MVLAILYVVGDQLSSYIVVSCLEVSRYMNELHYLLSGVI